MRGAEVVLLDLMPVVPLRELRGRGDDSVACVEQVHHEGFEFADRVHSSRAGDLIAWVGQGPACRKREAGCSSACRSRPRLSLGFPRVPFLFLRGVCWGLEWNAGHRGAAFTQVRDLWAMVGVTGFEPAASSSRTGDHCSLPCC